MPARKGSNTSSGAGSPSPPGGSRGGRMAQRRGSSAEAAVQAEVARLGHPNGVLKRGFLVKKGHVMPTRKERYFVLGQQSLSYYRPTKEGDVKLKGVLELKASDVISPMPHSDVWLRIRQNEGPGGKSYKLDLKASNQQARREWIESLRKACRGELLLRQRTLQSDVRLLHARASQRDRNVKAMAEFLSSPMSSDDASTPQADLRASFQILHEMLLLKKLVDTIKNAWGEPSQWSMAQYQELVQGICLAQEKSGSSDFEPDSILAEAFKLRYQFEEIPENQRKLSRDGDPLGAATRSSVDKLKQAELDSPVATPRLSPRIRCPSFHSYYATFEELSGRVGDTIKAASTDRQSAKTLTPRSATLAKYAHLYLLDDIRAKQPWNLDRSDDDNLVDREGSNVVSASSETNFVETLAGRFDSDRIYTYISHHTMVVMNPYRLLQTAHFTSIYDEQVVLTYADTANAEASLAPHPFAVAKQSLVRLFFDREIALGNARTSMPAGSTEHIATRTRSQTLFLFGESGSGKTELAKDLLKYLVLVAEPALSCDSKSMPASSRQPKIKLFTSSTKSTVQMRTEEARTIALLEAKGVESYEIVLLDLYPERWDEMTKVSRSKRLPQVHVDGLFFGFYDKLEHLEDEEQLRMYFKNPQAAKKLSTVLDSNIILEAFGHATTSMNLNSSRFGKSTGETFEVTLEKGQVNHVRDTLARLLYQLAFEYIVAAMNEATKMDAVTAREDYSAGSDTMAPHDVSSLKIVDVFGFEDLTHNSLDQLCINYLSEKLYAREEQVVLAAYCIQPSKILLDKDKDVLRIYEHPLGVFASLEELTILHQSENDTEQQEEKRNKLFVRNIYERNHSRLPEPPRILNSGKRQSSVSLTMVPFVIPYTRGSVVYDARDFVKKNSDFAYANLLTGLNASNNSHIRQMLKDSKALENGSNKNNSALSSTEVRVSASKSFVGQFRSHVNALTSDDDTNMPFYFHCIRPNEKKQPSVVSKDLVLQQCRSQRLIRQLEICSDPSTAYSAIGISKDIVLARYGSLVRAPYVLDEMASNEEELLKWLSDLLRNDDNPTPKISLSASSIVEFGKISLVEKLELFLEDREVEAAAKIQSLFRMITWRYRYLSKNRERRGLSNELLAWYGPQKKDTVTKLLTKYNGRENELRSKLELKKKSKLREQRAVHQLSSDLQSLCLGNRGGLDAQAVNDILHDDKMRELLQQNEKIVLALRDMSLNPTILESQLADHELRAFYQTLVDFLRSKRKEATTGQGDFPSNDVRPEGSLGDRVLAAASEGNRALWMRLVEHDEWAAYHDALVETLVLEKQREEEQRALAAITNLVQPSTVDEEEAMDLRASAVVDDEDAEMLELLLGVKFGPSLMVAMNADSYFVRGLQDPVLMTSLHQLMANPKDFAISTALQQPAVREFFLKLIALSFAVQEQSDEE
ncbi:hypothetical protein KRP22_015005 [Phytophthora ramorum]|nr:Myosin-I heavy chain [Phytophthora ramorum]